MKRQAEDGAQGLRVLLNIRTLFNPSGAVMPKAGPSWQNLGPWRIMRAQSCLTLRDPVDCSLSGSSVHEIFRQEYWSGLPFPSPRDLPNPGIKLLAPAASPALQADCLPLSYREVGYSLTWFGSWFLLKSLPKRNRAVEGNQYLNRPFHEFMFQNIYLTQWFYL